MEITLKIDNLTEVNEIKEWFRNKINDVNWVDNKETYFNTHRHIIPQDIFSEYLCNTVIDSFIDKKLMINATVLHLALSDVYKNVYSVLYEIYKTMDIDETEPDNDTLIEDCEVEEKVEYKTESTFEMPKIKNNKFMI